MLVRHDEQDMQRVHFVCISCKIKSNEHTQLCMSEDDDNDDDDDDDDEDDEDDEDVDDDNNNKDDAGDNKNYDDDVYDDDDEGNNDINIDKYKTIYISLGNNESQPYRAKEL